MNIAIAQSGGPTCAINASLVGAFSQALKTPEIDAVFGSINGIEGIIKDNLINLKNYINSTDDMELLKQTPSTVLGSCRYKLPDEEKDSTVYEKIMGCFKKHNIKAKTFAHNIGKQSAECRFLCSFGVSKLFLKARDKSAVFLVCL